MEKNQQRLGIAGIEDYVVITCQGEGATHKTDWSLLIAKQVVLWPNHDAAELKAMNRIAEKLGELNPQTGYEGLIRCVALSDSLTEKWDLTDALPTGW